MTNIITNSLIFCVLIITIYNIINFQSIIAGNSDSELDNNKYNNNNNNNNNDKSSNNNDWLEPLTTLNSKDFLNSSHMKLRGNQLTATGSNCLCPHKKYCGKDTCGIIGHKSACKCTAGLYCRSDKHYTCLSQPPVNKICTCPYASYCGADSCGIIGTNSACQCSKGEYCRYDRNHQCATTPGPPAPSNLECICPFADYCGPDSCHKKGVGSACQCLSGTTCHPEANYQCI